jgi:hypothetical protein
MPLRSTEPRNVQTEQATHIVPRKKSILLFWNSGQVSSNLPQNGFCSSGSLGETYTARFATNILICIQNNEIDPSKPCGYYIYHSLWHNKIVNCAQEVNSPITYESRSQQHYGHIMCFTSEGGQGSQRAVVPMMMMMMNVFYMRYELKCCLLSKGNAILAK